MKSSLGRRGADSFGRTAHCILVVEDELMIRMMLSEELRDAGFDVIEASDADEALSVLHSPACVDMVVSDVRMPGSMDGMGLLQVVTNSFPTIPMIITSAHLPATHATTDGATRFIPKPYEAERVVQAVEEELKVRMTA